MKGTIVEKAGAPVKVVDDLEVPEPAEDQMLVKPIYAALNPVETFMAVMGILVKDWPLTLAVDAVGIVVKAGPKAIGPLGPFKEGDEVCGCSRLGEKGHGTCAEYYLMDAAVTIPKPKNISLAEAAGVGVGFETACLGVFLGLGIKLPEDLSKLPTAHGEWTLVLGGAGSVGKYAVQTLKALGYKVAVTCSSRSNPLLESYGANLLIDYKKPEDEQIEELISKTDGKLYRVFDATSGGIDFSKKLLAKIEGGPKYFTSTDDWTPIESGFEDVTVDRISLGSVGNPSAQQLNNAISSYIPLIVKLIEDGKVQVSEYEIAGQGFEEVEKAWEYQKSGKAGSKKVLIHLQEA